MLGYADRTAWGQRTPAWANDTPRPMNHPGVQWPRGTHQGLSRHHAGLAVRGYTTTEIEKILGGNWVRYYTELLK